MHIYFSGIGGTGIGPLALIAHQAGFEVSGSDKQQSSYTEALQRKGIERIHIGQTTENIERLHKTHPIDWIVYSSAIEKEHQDHPELLFAKDNSIRATKRDAFLSELLNRTGLKLIAVAGTHGKTTTTAMLIWLFDQLEMPLSYSVGAKLSFGGLGHFDKAASYFVYEADEYDRNFLSFHPEIAVITGIDYDHPDIYPSRENYYDAFREFLGQSKRIVAHPADMQRIGLACPPEKIAAKEISLAGEVNRINAQVAIEVMMMISDAPREKLIEAINKFPGVSRRFEKISDYLFSDYAHTPEKIKGALQLAKEIAGEDVVVVYEGLHNTRQHFIRKELKRLFEGTKKLYIVPSYLAREDTSLEILTPEKLKDLMATPEEIQPITLNDELRSAIKSHIEKKELVLCLTAGGGGSLDEWLRANF
jgi:UDP-N-acetylmuramate--alanine ligase